MKFAFEKWQGCGNEYVFIDLAFSSQEKLPEPLPVEWVQKISDRKGPLGSDGLILLLPPQDKAKAMARMRMFNADASEAEMCGNGLRCLAAMIHERRPDLKKFEVETKAGLRACEILENPAPGQYEVRLNMGRPSFIPSNIPVIFNDVMVINEEFEIDGRDFLISCVSLGNPHCVVDVKDLENFPVEKYGPLFEKHEVFPNGVNVEFIEYRDGQVFQRTWERGSGETKACGTGACAVGVTLIMRNRVDSPVDIQLRGGKLKVEWDGLREVYLQGEAIKELEGEISWEPGSQLEVKTS